MTLKVKNPCIRCGSATAIEDGRRTCTACGHEAIARKDKHAQLENNAGDIIKDYFSLGPNGTCKKWQIATSSLYLTLKRHPELCPVDAKGPRARSAGGVFSILPPWRNDWPEAVQLSWLAVFDKLITPITKGRPNDHA